jgi:hypothetical protein
MGGKLATLSHFIGAHGFSLIWRELWKSPDGSLTCNPAQLPVSARTKRGEGGFRAAILLVSATAIVMTTSQIVREYRFVAQRRTAHGAPWTKEDVRELKAHSKARTPLREIEKKMKRVEYNL